MAKKAVSIVNKTAVVNLDSPRALADFSRELKKFIVENQLYTEIQGKNYVHVEGWQFAGASMGLFPVIEKYENVSPVDKTFSYKTKFGNGTAPVYKYTAEVKIVRLSTSETVGYGIALCSNEEKKKNTFDEYAVLSMAQTRAVGKAFRLSIGWIMKLAGYEATTAEEASDIEPEEPEAIAKPDIPFDDVKTLVDIKLAQMQSVDKVRFLRDHINSVSDKKITESQYRCLYDILSMEKSDGNGS